MKVALTILVLLLTTLSKAQFQDVKMDVDTALFGSFRNDSYQSEKNRAKIEALQIPIDFKKAIKDFKDEAKQKNNVVLDQGYLPKSNKDIYFLKTKYERKGIFLITEVYVIKISKEKSIIVAAIYPEDQKSRFKKSIESSVRSAVLK